MNKHILASRKPSSFRTAVCAFLSITLAAQPVLAAETYHYHKPVPGFQGPEAYLPGVYGNDPTNGGGGSNPTNPTDPGDGGTQPPTGGTPQLAFSTTTVDFGSVQANVSATRVFTLKNSGTGEATQLSVSGQGAAFQISSDCSTTLAAGSSCTVTVSFTGTATGTFGGSVSVTGKGISASSVSLRGQVVPAEAQAAKFTASPAVVNFGNVSVNATGTQSLVLTNNGAETVTVTGLSVVGSPEFAQSNNCGSPLPAGQSCSVNIAFAPGGVGSKTAQVLAVLGDESTASVPVYGVGTGAKLSTSVTSVQLTAGTTQPVVISNTGEGASGAIITRITGDAGFTVAGCAGATVAPQETCEVTVGYAPDVQVDGAKTAILTVSDGRSSVALTLQGTIPTPTISASAQSLDYGLLQVGATSAAQFVTFTNTGTAPARVSDLKLASGGSDYTMTHACGTSIAAGASCSAQVTFKPTAGRTRTGQLVLTSGSLNIPVTLNGTGLAPELKFEGVTQGVDRSIALANTAVGTTSPTKSFTLTNTGNATLTIQGISMTSDAYGGFAQSNNCGTALATQASCVISVNFTPQGEPALHSGVVLFATNAGPDAVQVRGSSTAPVVETKGRVTLSASGLSFGTLPVSENATQSVTLTNTGTAALKVTATSASTDYVATSDCTTIQPQATCAIQVKFTPTQAGARNGSVTIAHDGTGETSFSVTGTGAAASLALTTPSFPATTVGSTSTATVVITNNGLLSATLTEAKTTGAAFSVVSTDCGPSLAVNTTCSTTLRFSPTVKSTVTGSYSVKANGVAYSTSLTAKGTQGILSPSPSQLEFGAQQLALATSKGVVFTNTGDAPLTVSGVSISSGANDYSTTTNCGTLAPQGTCSVTVTFTPSAAGSRPGVLRTTVTGQSDASLSLTGTGAAPSVSLTAIEFGTIAVNSSATASAMLTNTGAAAVTLTPPSVGAVSGQDFQFVYTNCGAVLNAGASCRVDVSFSPTAAAQRTGQLTLSTGAGTRTASLKGAGLQSNMGLSVNAFEFGENQIYKQGGAYSYAKTQNVMVTNSSTNELTFASIGISSGSSDFSVKSTTCGATLAASRSCSVVVSYTAATPGPVSAVLTIAATDGAAKTVPMSAIGRVASMSYSGLEIGQATVNSTKSFSITVTNTGVDRIQFLQMDSRTISGGDFKFQASNCNNLGYVNPGATCYIYGSFKPTVAGSQAGLLDIRVLDLDNFQANLSGLGVQAIASVNKTALDFGTTQLGASNPPQKVTVANTGTDVLTVVSAESNLPDVFPVSNGCSTVNPGSSCEVSVGFTPSAAGGFTSQVLTIKTSDKPFNVALSGYAQAATASLTTPSFAPTAVGATTLATAVLTNTGIGALTLTKPDARSVGGTDFSFDSTTCLTTLGAGQSCEIVVKFAPTSSVPRNGSLNLSTNAGTKTAVLGSTGIQGYAYVSPPSVTFAPTQVQQSAVVAHVTVTNTGTNTLTFAGIDMLDGTAHFGQSNNCGSVPVNGSCVIDVMFTPSAVGSALAGHIVLQHDGGGLAVVELAGEGRAAAATLSVPSFTATKVGASANAVATLANTGVGPVSVTAFNASALTGAGFTYVSSDCAPTLNAGTSCVVNLRFTPTAGQAYPGNLAINTSAGSQSVDFTATGLQAVLTLSPAAGSTLTVPTTNVGVQSSAATITVSNTGNDSLTLNSFPITGTNAAEFGKGGTCVAGQALASNANCTVTVTITPTATGTRTGLLTFTYDTNKTATVNLSATANQSAASLTAGTTTAFGTVDVGSSVTLNFTYSVSGNSAGTGVYAVLNGGSDLSFVSNNCGTAASKVTVNAGTSCTMSVKYMPAAYGALSGASLAVYSATSTPSPASLTLTGTGSQAVVSLTPNTTADFGGVAVNSSTNLVFTYQNTGNKAATGVAASLTGTTTYLSIVTGAGTTCGVVGATTTLAAASSCQITVKYNPTANNTIAASLQVVSSAKPATSSVALTGVTSQATGALTADTSTSFGYVPSGSGANLSFTFKNVGGIAATGTYAAFPGSLGLSFVSNTCGTSGAQVSIPAGGSCAMTVRFAPTNATTSLNGAALTVTSSATNGVQSLALDGVSASLMGSGGAITFSGNYAVHTFRSSGTFTFNSAPIGGGGTLLVVAGGGGGSFGGGGGGGMRVLNLTAADTAAGSSYAVTVGAGGAYAPIGASGFNTWAGSNGGNSAFGSLLVANGGGGGGGYGDSSAKRATSGGSGGGGGCAGSGQGSNTGGAAAIVTNPVQGYAGGSGWSQDGAGGSAGGGGAGGVGGNSPAAAAAGAAGPGKTSGVTGVTGTFSAGGAGLNCQVATTGAIGAANTGNGGGGGNSQSSLPGSGGSGIVVVVYQYK